MPRVVFLSHHVYESPRRAGFHALARAYAAGGWQVAFVTTGISLLSLVRRDPRIRSISRDNLLSSSHQPDGVRSHVGFTILHPANLPTPLGRAAERLIARTYGGSVGRRLTRIVRDADMIVFESNASLLLAPALRRIVPGARFVYRVSDDVGVIGMATTILEAEQRALRLMDLVSVPSRALLERRFGGIGQARFQPHGVPQELLGATFADPYRRRGRPILACVGSTLFDADFARQAARTRPLCDFHYVGHVPTLARIEAANIYRHGERPFREALAFSAFADVGIANYALPENGEYLAETSNKMLQYAYLGKPIVAPAQIAAHVRYRNVFYYQPGDGGSIAQAIDAALKAGPTTVDPGQFVTWNQVRDMMLDELSLPQAC